jgi:hypothetical protein
MQVEESFSFASLLGEDRADLAETDDEEDEDLKEEEDEKRWKNSSDSDDEVPIEEQEKEEPFPVCATFWVCVVDDLLAANKVSYERHLEDLRVPETGEREFDLARGKKRFKYNAESDSQSIHHQGSKGQECEGDRRVKKLRHLFSTGFKTRVRDGDDAGAFQYILASDDQLYFLEECTFSCLPNIYGHNEWAVHCPRVLAEWGRKAINYFLMM